MIRRWLQVWKPKPKGQKIPLHLPVVRLIVYCSSLACQSSDRANSAYACRIHHMSRPCSLELTRSRISQYQKHRCVPFNNRQVIRPITVSLHAKYLPRYLRRAAVEQ